MRKIVSTVLLAILLNVAFSLNVFAQANSVKINQFTEETAVLQKVVIQNEENKDVLKTVAKTDFYKNPARSNSKSTFDSGEKNTLAAYEKSKAAGKKFSTKTKVLIGIGITAAVVGIFVFAASRDKIKTF